MSTGNYFNLQLGVRNLLLNIFSWFTWWVNMINVFMAHLANTTPLPINVMGLSVNWDIVRGGWVMERNVLFAEASEMPYSVLMKAA